MSIGIVGAGISGLHLALRLQAAGVETTLYASRSAQEMRESRLPNTVARFWSARSRERELGVDHWPDWEWRHVHFSVAGTPLAFTGRCAQPPSSIDFRIYLPALLEDYEARGGDVVVAPVSAESIDDWSHRHELMVLAAGGRDAAGLLPRDAARSPFDTPQRRLCAGVFRGLAPADPIGLTYVVVPGIGEIFGMPFLTLEGPLHNLLIEAVPGGPLEPLTTISYDDDPAAFDEAIVAALDEFAAPLAQRVQRSEFGLTRSLDLLQGAITPTVREPYIALSSGRWLIGVGDAWVINDPIVGQGANLGARAAWILADAILEEQVYDELFCRTAARRMWEAAEPVTNFTNAFLTPPPPHVLELLGAASQDQSIADELVHGFERPDLMWRRIATPQRTAALLAAHGAPAMSSPG
jgi:hypothetical protein